MSLASKIGSDEMEVERKNNVTNLAKEMAKGRVMMPRSKIDYKDLIKVELDSSKNIITERLITARATIPIGNGWMYGTSHNFSAEMLEGFPTYSEGVAHVIEEAVNSAEVLINNAICEAREILRSTLYVPPLFLLATDKKSVKSLYNWLARNTQINAGVIAWILSITETGSQDTSYMRISNDKVERLNSTEFALSLSTHFNFTAILNFVSSYDTKNIPCMDEVTKYHKHVSIAKRY